MSTGTLTFFMFEHFIMQPQLLGGIISVVSALFHCSAKFIVMLDLSCCGKVPLYFLFYLVLRCN